MKRIVSILLPLHNEGRIVGNALTNLAGIIDEYTEVIAGLDGCTDNTEHIVRQYPFVKVIAFPSRLGKHEVINKMTEAAKGDVIIVHDADWILVAEGGIETIRTVFDDSCVGGLSVPIDGMPAGREEMRGATLAFRGENVVAHYFTEYQFSRCIIKEKGGTYVDNMSACHPFMVTIYRKGAVDALVTTADDMERSLSLRKKGLRVRVIDFPEHQVYFKVCDVDKTIKVIFVRHVRSYISVNRVKKIFAFTPSVRFYLSASGYVFYKTLLKHPCCDVFAVLLWYAVTACACLTAKIVGAKRLSVQRLWGYRADRGLRTGA